MGKIKPIWHYFLPPGIAMILGVGAALYFGGPAIAFTVAVLAVLEISLSFDNAIVNARVLKNWDERWRQIFLGIGIIIAVFGMRLVFPVAVVAVAAHISPYAAVNMALFNPNEYGHQLHLAHPVISAFGGAFLLMVGLNFFIDEEKDHHWFPLIEGWLTKVGFVEAVQAFVGLSAVYIVSRFLPDNIDRYSFFSAGFFGIATHVCVDALGKWTGGDDTANKVIKQGIGGFLYLEVLDASFSFDGVIGAFALTNNVIWIMIGLAIGAFAVRELTVLAVDRETLDEYEYLEHGAFWAILALAIIMLVSPLYPIPEYITGLIGAVLIGAAFISSLIANKRVSDEISAVHRLP